jgi:hypothetical protein
MVNVNRFHLILFHYDVYALSRFFIKYWSQHIFEIPVIVLAKAKRNLLVRIRVKRAATDVNLQPMS